ncbi:hypothetical protein GCM10022380_40010 [Amycolatopsis tucumanensis]|uniref:Uncharacterized protein n=1 Tax=Amycolatopsis tucumanensis TaxID=401106 RepID=A0ABP7IG14_9PSEU
MIRPSPVVSTWRKVSCSVISSGGPPGSPLVSRYRRGQAVPQEVVGLRIEVDPVALTAGERVRVALVHGDAVQAPREGQPAQPGADDGHAAATEWRGEQHR